MITSPAFGGRRYAVLGLARSGQAAVASLLAGGAQVTAWDAREEPRAALLAEHADAVVAGRLSAADPCAIDLVGYAAIVVSPGVPINRHPVAEAARAAGVPLIGDIELFAQSRASLPAHRVVGITGTNGKSTTTALIHHLLTCGGVAARMAGNIGVPILSEEPLSPNLRGSGVYVLELSSYQLDLTQALDCDVAMLLNLSPDHLDRYADFAAYGRAKARLFAMQAKDSPAAARLAIVDAEAARLAALPSLAGRGWGRGSTATRWGSTATPGVAASVGTPLPTSPLTGGGACGRLPGWVTIDTVELPGDQADWPALHGPHNRANAAAAVAAVRWLGVSEAAIAAGLNSFAGLPHRMERVAQAGGVLFINDSKATNPASTAPALAAFPPDPQDPGQRRRIHWIVGGLPKGDDLDECAPWFSHVAAAYTIGDAGARFAELLEPHMPVARSEMLVEAVRQAIAAARPGDVVLLSPACASFDQFRDYEARGLAFCQIVEALIAAADPASCSPESRH